MSKPRTIRRWKTRAAGILLLLSTAWYLPWLIRNLNWHVPWLSVPFAAATILTAITALVTACNHWLYSVPDEQLVPAGEEPAVVVLMPTCGEPPRMLYETARSVLDQDYPQEKITLVVSDDTHRPNIRSLVRRLNREYPEALVAYHEPLPEGHAQRPGHGKAGNLNSASAAADNLASQVRFVETRDADDTVGDGSFLRKTVAQLMADDHVAFVQTVKEAVVSSGDPFGNLEPFFYRRAMLAKNAANAVFSCGSGVVWRREALEDIGGFPTWNIVEDLQSGVEALRRGWRGVYMPIVGVLAQSAPEDMPNIVKQRGTWALDTIRLTFWGNKRGLSLRQRLHFLELGLFYMISVAVLVFAITPLFALLFNIHPVATGWGQYELHFWPHVLAIELLLRSIVDGLPRGALSRARKMWVGMAPVYARAILTALRYGRRRIPAYRVTRKEHIYALYWRQVLPQIVVFLSLLVASAWHVVTSAGLRTADLGSLVWAGFFMGVFSGIIRNSWHGIDLREALHKALWANQRPARRVAHALALVSSVVLLGTGSFSIYKYSLEAHRVRAEQAGRPPFATARADLAGREGGPRTQTDLDALGRGVTLSRLWMQGQQAYEAGKWPEAIEAYEALIDLGAETYDSAAVGHLFESYLQQAIDLVESSQWESAPQQAGLTQLQKALALRPQGLEASGRMASDAQYVGVETPSALADTMEGLASDDWAASNDSDAEGYSAKPAASHYERAAQFHREAKLTAVHTGGSSARALYAAHVELAIAHAKEGTYGLAVEAVENAIRIAAVDGIAPGDLLDIDHLARPAARALALNPAGQVGLGVYMHSVLSDEYAAVHRFENLIEHKMQYVLWFQTWGGSDRVFSADWARLATQKGFVPVITWEPWQRRFIDPTEPQPQYSLGSIAAGQHDAYIRSWAQAAKSLGTPVIIRFAHEQSTEPGTRMWYPWQGDPAAYNAAYRHLVGIFREEGADNAEFLWGSMWIDQWASEYYPGDDVVDYVGTTVLNHGTAAKTEWAQWRSFDDLFGAQYDAALQWGKPIIITELATAEQGGAKAAWLRDCLASLEFKYPAVQGVILLEIESDREWPEVNWSVTSSQESLVAVKQAIDSPYFR